MGRSVGRTLAGRLAAAACGAAVALALAARAEGLAIGWGLMLVRTGTNAEKALAMTNIGLAGDRGVAVLLALSLDRRPVPLGADGPYAALVEMDAPDTLGDLALDALRRMREGPPAARTFAWELLPGGEGAPGKSYGDALEEWRRHETVLARRWWDERRARPAGRPPTVVPRGAGSGRRTAPVSEAEAEAAVLGLLQVFIEDFAAIKDEYPELAEWDLREPVASGRGHSIRYSFRYDDSPRVRVRFGRHGCDLALLVGFGGYDAVPNRPSKRWYPHVGAAVCFWFRRGVMSSTGFGEEMSSIFKRFLRSLNALDRRAGRRRRGPRMPPAEAPSAEEVRAAVDGALQGMIDDVTALKAKHPELAEWHVEAPVNGGFTYQYRYSGATDPPEVGEHGCHVGAWIRPESGPPPFVWLPRYRFPNLGLLAHTWNQAGEGTSEGFCAEVQSICCRHMAAIEELEWRAELAREGGSQGEAAPHDRAPASWEKARSGPPAPGP